MSTAVVSYQPTSLAELETFCERLAKSGNIPQQYRGKPNDVYAACLWGWETAGLGPMTSLSYINVIQGRPAYSAEGLVAIALLKGYITDEETEMVGTFGADDYAAVCTVTKRNGKTVTRKFSVADAKRAGLLGKDLYGKYLDRMLSARARAFSTRDAAPDAMLGYAQEEARDIEAAEQPRDPAKARDVTPGNSASPTAEVDAALAGINSILAEQRERLTGSDDPAVQGGCSDEPAPEPQDDDPLRIAGLSKSEAFSALKWALEDADALECDTLWELYRAKAAKFPKHLCQDLENILVAKIGGFQGTPGDRDGEVTAAPIG